MSDAIYLSSHLTMVICPEPCTLEQFLTESCSLQPRVWVDDRLQDLVSLGIFLVKGELQTVEI